jgi:hypothetical protein
MPLIFQIQKIKSSKIALTPNPNSTLHTSPSPPHPLPPSPTAPSRYAPCPIHNPRSKIERFPLPDLPVSPSLSLAFSPPSHFPIFPTSFFPPSAVSSSFPIRCSVLDVRCSMLIFSVPSTPPSLLIPQPCFSPTFSSSHLLIFPTSFFPGFLHLNQIWFKNHI